MHGLAGMQPQSLLQLMQVNRQPQLPNSRRHACDTEMAECTKWRSTDIRRRNLKEAIQRLLRHGDAVIADSGLGVGPQQMLPQLAAIPIGQGQGPFSQLCQAEALDHTCAGTCPASVPTPAHTCCARGTSFQHQLFPAHDGLTTAHAPAYVQPHMRGSECCQALELKAS